MRRLLIVGLWMLGTTSAFAADPQDEDDEKPGSRQKGVVKPAADHTADEPTDSPPQADPAPRSQPARGEPAPSDVPKPDVGEPVRASGPTGDAPLNLDARGVHSEGHYGGVSLGGQRLPPKAPRLPMKGPQRMTWPGFQMRDGLPTVFLQTTGAPDYVVSEAPGSLVVTLRGTTIKLRNNERPLKVADFGTTVTEVSAKPKGHDVIVTIRRKEGGGHHESVEQSAGGYQVLVVQMEK